MSTTRNITNIELADTFQTLFVTTRTLVDEVNDILINDIRTPTLSGLSITKSDYASGLVATIDLNLALNGGIRVNSDNELIIDIFTLPETDNVTDNDYYIIESSDTTNDGSDLKRVKSNNILPLLVSGNHIFKNIDNTEDSFISFETDTVFLNSLNVLVKNPFIYLNYDEDTGNDFFDREAITSGIKIPTSTGPVSWEYRGLRDSWVTASNIGFIGTTGKFVNYRDSYTAIFVAGIQNNQKAVSIRLQKDAPESDRYWELFSDGPEDRFIFRLVDESSDGNAFSSFTAFRASGETDQLFTIHGRVYIDNLSGSQQFKAAPTATFESNLVPLTNTDGLLSYKWSNRFVTEDADIDVNVGDIVRIAYDSSGIHLTRAIADPEAEDESLCIGIVERIYGTKYHVVLNGEFNVSGVAFNLDYGKIYYLSDTTYGGLTDVKPTGLAKPVLVATGSTSGILFASANSQTPAFSNVYLENDGSTVEADVIKDTFTIVGGHRTYIYTDSDNKIVVDHIDGPEQPAYRYVKVGSTLMEAQTAYGELEIFGLNGITVTANDETNGGNVFISAPNGFGRIYVTNTETDGDDFIVTSFTSNDTVVFRGGIGIDLRQTSDGDIEFVATGEATLSMGSIDNVHLADMPAFAVKCSNSIGDVVDVQLEPFPTITKVGAQFNIGGVLYDGPGPGGDGVPDVGGSAGYLLGRYVDEDGNISSITRIDRTALRLILGAQQTGWLSPVQNVYSTIYVRDLNNNDVGDSPLIPQETDDSLVFRAGTAIELFADDNSVGTKEITIGIDSTYLQSFVDGFTVISTSSGSYNAGEANGELFFSDTETINATIDTNQSITFDVQDNSITNSKLAIMPDNSIKASYGSTQGTPDDLEILEDRIVGRPSGGFLSALTGSEVREIINVPSVYRLIDSIGNTIADVNGDFTTSSGLKFREGPGIQLNGSGSTITISNTSASTAGYRFAKSYEDATYSSDEKILFDIAIKNSPTWGNSATFFTYKNIKILSTSSNNITRFEFDMAGMPPSSLKIAGDSPDNENSALRVPANLVMGDNTILFKQSGAARIQAVSPVMIRSLIGINTFYNYGTFNTRPDNTEFSGGTFIARSPVDGIYFIAGPRVPNTDNQGLKITTTTKLGYPAIQISSSAIDELSDDTSPSLGGDLEVGTKEIISNTFRMLKFVPPVSAQPEFMFHLDNVNINDPTFKVERISGTATGGNLKLKPYGTGSVIIDSNNLSGNTTSGNLNFISNTNTFTFAKADASTSTITTLSSTSGLSLFASDAKTINLSIGSTENRYLSISNDTTNNWIQITPYQSTNKTDIYFDLYRNVSASAASLYVKGGFRIISGSQVGVADTANYTFLSGTGQLQFSTNTYKTALFFDYGGTHISKQISYYAQTSATSSLGNQVKRVTYYTKLHTIVPGADNYVLLDGFPATNHSNSLNNSTGFYEYRIIIVPVNGEHDERIVLSFTFNSPVKRFWTDAVGLTTVGPFDAKTVTVSSTQDQSGYPGNTSFGYSYPNSQATGTDNLPNGRLLGTPVMLMSTCTNCNSTEYNKWKSKTYGDPEAGSATENFGYMNQIQNASVVVASRTYAVHDLALGADYAGILFLFTDWSGITGKQIRFMVERTFYPTTTITGVTGRSTGDLGVANLNSTIPAST